MTLCIKINEIPHDFICPITLEIMDDPVICDDGYTYERKAILQLNNSISPMTRQQINKSKLISNRALKNIIDRFYGENKILELEKPNILLQEHLQVSLLQERLQVKKYKYKIKNPNCKICIINKRYDCDLAARYGHLDCLKYAHEEYDSPWNAWTCKYAAENGNLDCLIYAHDYFNFY